MNRHTTDQLLTLGMALTTDKKTMERRVRGVFARKKSAKGVVALSLVLALALGFAAFTTACQPGESVQTLTPIPVEHQDSSALQSKPAARATDEPDSNVVPVQWKTERNLLDSMVERPFQYPDAPAHVDEPAYELANGVSVRVNADVVIPQTTGYGVRQCSGIGFTLDDYRRMIDYFLPNAKWVPNQTEPGFQTNGAYDLSDIDFTKRTTLSVEQDGALYSAVIGAGQQIFGFQRAGGMVYRESYLLGDVEMEQLYGEEIRTPIDLTREAAGTQADKVLVDLGIQNWQLDNTERACMFASGDSQNVLSRGWNFTYVLSNAGLPVHYNNGMTGMEQDAPDYGGVYTGVLSIYVDESGVSFLYWYNYYNAGQPLFTNVEIIGAKKALALAKARVERSFGQQDIGVKEVEVYAIRLSSMLIGYPDETDFDSTRDAPLDTAYMIPSWDVSCCVSFRDGRVEYTVIPFCATDGGSIVMQ
ncbi:MAG TPA: hypothetical protein PKA81_01665 [Clostridia bacterium]|nr:hypothetical protein [Clostridia bacterium]